MVHVPTCSCYAFAEDKELIPFRVDSTCWFEYGMLYWWLWLELLWPNVGPAWWRHQMQTFSALLAICTGNSPVPGEFTAQRPVTRNFDVFFDLRPNKRLSKQSGGWWFETPPRPLWRHRNEFIMPYCLSRHSIEKWNHILKSITQMSKG